MDENHDTRQIPDSPPWDQPPPAAPAVWPTAAPPPRPAPRRRRWPLVLAVLLVLFSLLAGAVVLMLVVIRTDFQRATGGSPLAGYVEQTVESGTGDNRILMIDINGVISSDEGCGPLALAALRRLRKDGKPENVSTVLLKVNSPGGTVTCCDAIDGEIQKCLATRKIRFVAFYDEMAASGGYYVSARSERIIARPTCLVGSIGVIGLSLNADRLLREKLGIEAQAIKSVPFKDVPSMFRPMTDAERDYMQKMIDDMHKRFLGVVGGGRKLTEEEVAAFANGKVYLADEALSLRMIDAVGDWDDAMDAARQIAGDSNAPIITYRRRPSPLEMMLQARAERPLVPEDLRITLETAARGRFCYLWLP